VLCAGTVLVDVTKRVDRFARPDRLALIDRVTLSTGGPALNLAADLARLGGGYPLGIAGMIGDDAHGAFLTEQLHRLGVDTSRLRVTDAASTSFTDAMVLRENGSRAFYHHVGANALFTPDDVGIADSTARIMHLGAPGLQPGLDADGGAGWVDLLARARAAGMHTNLELVSIDPETLRSVAGPALPHLDSLIVNEIEASALAGVRLEPMGPDDADWGAIERAAHDLFRRGVRRLVAVHCPAGAVAVTADGRVHRQGSVRLPAELQVNATGAGDAFAAGVIHGLHEGWDAAAGLRAGVCVAAACLTGVGTNDGIPPLADCLALAEQYGFRAVGSAGGPGSARLEP